MMCNRYIKQNKPTEQIQVESAKQVRFSFPNQDKKFLAPLKRPPRRRFLLGSRTRRHSKRKSKSSMAK